MFTQFLKTKDNRYSTVGGFWSASLFVVMFLISPASIDSQQKRAPGRGQRAVVIDERLAALREKPSLFAPLLKRLSRGRLVSILNAKRSPEGVMFYRIAVTRRTRGWLQSEAMVSAARHRDDERLLDLIRASKDFDRIARASIFLETFRSSDLRPEVLLILGTAAEDVARKLSAEASKRLDGAEMKANRASTLSYFMNFNGLDRYRRLGINFVFDELKSEYHYNGAAWREIARRYPKSVEAVNAREHLDALAVTGQNRER